MVLNFNVELLYVRQRKLLVPQSAQQLLVANVVLGFFQISLGVNFFQLSWCALRNVKLIFVFLFDNLTNGYRDSQDMMLAKVENLVPENSTQINFKTVTEKSDYPLKQEEFAGAVICFQILIKLMGVLAAKAPENFICFEDLFVIG